MQDPLVQYRDVLPVTYAFGTASCWSGYEGIQSDDDRFLTCHYNIFEPSWLQRNSIPLIIGYVYTCARWKRVDRSTLVLYT